MNIADIKDIPHVEPEEYLHKIFERQLELLLKYKEIEGIPQWPFDLDNASHQAWLKDFLWRTTEEIAESLEAYYNNHKTHQVEELADALHFIVGCMILSGIEPGSWSLEEEILESQSLILEAGDDFLSACFSVFYYAGLLGNVMKNKAWKISQVQTDKDKFVCIIREVFQTVLATFIAAGCSEDEVYTYYFKKSEVNKFRQRTNY